jgi:histone H3/H4
MSSADAYKKCSTCREPIAFDDKYFTCSVSTCNRPRLALYFCSLPCWEAHVPEARHRDAWAEEQRAPSRSKWLEQREGETMAAVAAEAPRTARIVTGAPEAPRAARIVTGFESHEPAAADDEVLIVVSKLKKYVREQSGMNTSDSAMAVLSQHLRALARQAINHATEEGRKTVMDRDFLPFLNTRK